MISKRLNCIFKNSALVRRKGGILLEKSVSKSMFCRFQNKPNTHYEDDKLILNAIRLMTVSLKLRNLHFGIRHFHGVKLELQLLLVTSKK